MSLRVVEEFIYELEKQINRERPDRLQVIFISPPIFSSILDDREYSHPKSYRPMARIEEEGRGYEVIQIRGVIVRPMKIFRREDAVAWESDLSCGCCLMRREYREDYGRMYDPREMPADMPRMRPEYKINPKPEVIGSRSFLEELKEI